jgi:hypothetical protein
MMIIICVKYITEHGGDMALQPRDPLLHYSLFLFFSIIS